MNELIEEIYNSRKVEDLEGNIVNPFPSALSYELGTELYDCICKNELKNTLEIGLAYGLSALFICQAHRDLQIGGHHIAIDPMESKDFKSIGLLNIKRADLDDVFRFYESCSYEVLPQLYQDSEMFDLIFIDGMHLFDFALVDFFFADILLKIGGYLVFDDVWMPSIRKVVMFVLNNRHYELAPDFFSNRSSILRRAGNFISNVVKDYHHRRKLRRIINYAVKNPSDLPAISSAMYLGGKGRVDYWCLKKLSDDDREWHHYRAF